MGHGASTNVKKLTLYQGKNSEPRTTNEAADTTNADGDDDGGARAPSPSKPGWTRSSSDGCIVENLNTSKTKTELLEQQVQEYKELFHHAEQKAEEAQSRAKLLEGQMAEVEGTNFELLDRVSDLEQQLEESRDQMSPEAEREFSQTLMDRDQVIEKQEQEIKRLEEDLAKMRTKLRKKLRSAQTELAEVKQESGLKMYSLKDQIASLQEENAQLIERLDRAHSNPNALSRQSSAAAATPSTSLTKDTPMEEEWEDSRTKVILELSSQLSTQEQRISELEEKLREQDRMLSAQRANPRPPSGSQRKHSGRSVRSRSAEKRTEVPEPDSTKGQALDEDASANHSAAPRQRQSSSKEKDNQRSSSAKSQTSSNKQVSNNHLGDELDNPTTHETRSIGSAGSGSRKVRQPSANSLDSAISDHSDSGSAKVSSANSSRQRRRLKNHLSRQSSAEGPKSGTEINKAQSDITVEGRDSGIGVSADAKSKYNDDMDQLIQNIIRDS